MRHPHERQLICDTGRLLWERGHIAGYEGNLSLRVQHGRESHLLITPAGLCKGMLAPTDIVEIDLNGKQDSGSLRATSEVALHTGVYRLMPETQAVIHTHSPHATACSALAEGLDTTALPEAAQAFGSVGLVPWAPAGSDELYYTARPLLAKHRALLLERHGMLCYSTSSLLDAFHLSEQVEHLARIYLLLRTTGALR